MPAPGAAARLPRGVRDRPPPALSVPARTADRAAGGRYRRRGAHRRRARRVPADRRGVLDLRVFHRDRRHGGRALRLGRREPRGDPHLPRQGPPGRLPPAGRRGRGPHRGGAGPERLARPGARPVLSARAEALVRLGQRRRAAGAKRGRAARARRSDPRGAQQRARAGGGAATAGAGLRRGRGVLGGGGGAGRGAWLSRARRDRQASRGTAVLRGERPRFPGADPGRPARRVGGRDAARAGRHRPSLRPGPCRMPDRRGPRGDHRDQPAPGGRHDPAGDRGGHRHRRARRDGGPARGRLARPRAASRRPGRDPLRAAGPPRHDPRALVRPGAARGRRAHAVHGAAPAGPARRAGRRFPRSRRAGAGLGGRSRDPGARAGR